MPFSMGLELENHQHIMPLLHFYLREINPQLKDKAVLDDDDWEHIPCPDGNVAHFRLDVKTNSENSGTANIRDGYFRALAVCAKNGYIPERIRIVTIIHHPGHWTCSSTEIELDPEFRAQLQLFSEAQSFADQPTFSVVNELNMNFHPKQAIEIGQDFRLYGCNKITIKHYDSHNADPERQVGDYYKNYTKTLEPLKAANPDKSISITPEKCKQQTGNTCGDNALWNGTMAGVLALNPKEEFVQIESSVLRSFSEHQIPALKRVALAGEEKLASQLRSQLQENIALAKEFAESTLSTVQPEVPKAQPPKPQAPKAQTPKAPILTKKTTSKAKREPPQIYFFDETSKKNKNVNKLLHRFGEGLDTIRNHIEQEYSERKTERGIKGFFQRLNAKIGHVATKRRKNQMDQLARLINKLQKEKTLNNNEKGIILQGLLKEIIDDITLNEPKNWYNSRLKGMCTKLSQDLDNMEIYLLRNQQSKNLYHVYFEEGTEAFRQAASQYLSKTPHRFRK